MRSSTTIILLFLVCLVGCFAKQAEVTEASTSTRAVQELTPPSELALMMRAMAAHADSAKAAIGRGDELPAFPKSFSGLLTATPTQGMHIDPITFPTFGKDYQAKLGKLYKVKKVERTQAYNALVQSCANCHGSHCPGPLMRIKKMYVKTEE